MKMSDLETMIAKRADNNVQARIMQFKLDIQAAVAKLFVDSHSTSFGRYREAMHLKDAQKRARGVVMGLAMADTDDDGKKLGWPSTLWDNEQETLRTELQSPRSDMAWRLSKMDLLQQMLLAKPRNNENDVPQENGE